MDARTHIETAARIHGEHNLPIYSDILGVRSLVHLPGPATYLIEEQLAHDKLDTQMGALAIHPHSAALWNRENAGTSPCTRSGPGLGKGVPLLLSVCRTMAALQACSRRIASRCAHDRMFTCRLCQLSTDGANMGGPTHH